MNQKSDLGNPHVLLIGGTKGLGRVLAELQAKKGYNVSILARSTPEDSLINTANVSFYSGDLLDPSSIKNALTDIIETRGLIDHLVFLQRSRMPKEDSSKNWENEIQISLVASKIIIEFLTHNSWMKKGGGIVFVSSMGGASYVDSQPLEYGIAKAGFNQMIRHYAVDLGVHQIRVNGVSCFTFLKEESKSYFLQNEKLQKVIHQVVPLQRMATALDMAKAIQFFCTEEASFISGQVLTVDGGLSAVGHETIAFWASGARER